MNAVMQLPPKLDADRDQLVMAVSASVVDRYALDVDDERAITSLVEGWVFDLTEIADSAAAKLAELRAVQRRADRHVAGHRGCRFPGCLALGALRQRISQLERQVASEFEALKRGRR